jgi:hypothetical protein
MIDHLNFNEELVKTIISYVVPALLAAAITFIGPLASFLWRDVLRTWRSVVVIGLLAISFWIAPTYCVWIAFATFIALSLDRLRDFQNGAIFADRFLILFAGFYCLSTQGKLERSGNSELLDVRMFKSLRQLVADHKIQEFTPLKLRWVKIPSIIYRRDTYESFDRRMQRYAASNLGVVWGIVDQNGRVVDFRITVNEQLYWGRDLVTKLARDISRVFEIDGVSTSNAVDFVSMVLAAVWGQSFCSMLNHIFGKWQASLQLASQSRTFIEQAVARLERHEGDKARSTATFLYRRLVPMCLFEEATAHGGNKDDRALDKLHEALMIDPLWPLDEQEFAEFYNNRYAWELSNTEIMSAKLASEQPKYYVRGLLRTPPNLQIFVDWIGIAANVTKVKDLNAKLFNWFDSLTKKYPENVFVFLFWADAIRTLSRAKDAEKGKEGSFTEGYLPPLKTLNRMIGVLERAATLRPNFPIISTRLSVLYVMSSFHYRSGGAEHRERMRLAAKHARTGARFIDEFLPYREPEDESEHVEDEPEYVEAKLDGDEDS